MRRTVIKRRGYGPPDLATRSVEITQRCSFDLRRFPSHDIVATVPVGSVSVVGDVFPGETRVPQVLGSEIPTSSTPGRFTSLSELVLSLVSSSRTEDNCAELCHKCLQT